MDTNTPAQQEKNEFNFKLDRYEKIISYVALAMFFFSMMGPQNRLMTLAFFIFSGAIMLYYFIWYRKKPPYVRIDAVHITLYPPLFFKPVSIPRAAIREVGKSANMLLIRYSDKETAHSAPVNLQMLSSEDAEKLYSLLKPEAPGESIDPQGEGDTE